MKTYNEVLKKIMAEGVDREGRNGWTRALFAIQMRFPMHKGVDGLVYDFPAVTTKKLHLKSIMYELLWFLKGDTQVKYLFVKGRRLIMYRCRAAGDYDAGRFYFPYISRRHACWVGNNRKYTELRELLHDEMVKLAPHGKEENEVLGLAQV